MKIDKIAFSCSEEFSPFWNIQSFVWKEMLGIEPVCILWGDIKNTNMKDTYGEIIEKKYNPDMVKSFQLTWSKFYHTQTEPEKTWIIGDIDLFPLQKEWFVDKIKDLPDHVYTHLAYGAMNGGKIIERPDGTGVGLTAYYHVAKGKTFITALGLNECSFEEQVKRVINDPHTRFGRPTTQEYLERYNKWNKHHGFKSFMTPENDDAELQWWLADERYSSYRIKKAIGLCQPGHGPNLDLNNPNAKEYLDHGWNLSHEIGGRIEFVSHITPNFAEAGQGRGLIDRVDRIHFHDGNYHCWDLDKLQSKKYVDLHAHRPYHEQEESLLKIISVCWSDKILELNSKVSIRKSK